MQRTRPKRPILRLKSSRNRRDTAEAGAEPRRRQKQHVTREEDFSPLEPGNFATDEPDVESSYDPIRTGPADPAMRSEVQAAQESETGVRQPGEQWPEGDQPEERFKKQVRRAKRDLDREHRHNR